MNEVFREENKFLINSIDYMKIDNILGSTLLEDPNNGPKGYKVRSLYFDTLDDNDYEEKDMGIELRRKIRLRIYDPSNKTAKLEMKQKQGKFQKKRSLTVSRDVAEELTRGNYYSLLKYSDPFASECFAYMTMKCYRPKTIVEYDRKAFIAKENKTRITLDSHIISTESCYDIFAKNIAMSNVLDDFNSVLEVKYNGFLLSYIKDILGISNRLPIAVSKYCLARSSTLHYKF